jgi:glycosyl-4,4'-diaponeurosporenoate acyltransferase
VPTWVLPDVIVVVLNAAFWLVDFTVVGWIAARTPSHRLDHDGPVLRLRGFETGGRWYERELRINRWKDRLPEAGSAFGGRSKRTLPGRTDDALRAFAAETRRAERTHWSSLIALPLVALWNEPIGFAVMVVFGIVANAPFIAIQRSNRARIERVLTTRRARRVRSDA